MTRREQLQQQRQELEAELNRIEKELSEKPDSYLDTDPDEADDVEFAKQLKRDGYFEHGQHLLSY